MISLYLKLFTAVFISFALVTCSFNNATLTASPPILKLQEVASMQVVRGLAGTKPSPLYTNEDANGTAMITKIVGWINASVPLGTQPEYGRHGYPRKLKILLNNGESIYVELGYKCVTSKTPPPGVYSPHHDAVYKSCSNVDNEIVLANSSTQTRIKSSELYEWLKSW